MGSTGKSSNTNRLEELKKELETAKGLIAKAKIKAEIRMIESGFKGTLEEFRAKEREAFEKRQAETLAKEKAKLEEQRKEREKKEKESKESLEKEFKTQPKDKVEQFKIIQETNPMKDDFHVGIRKPSDIKTWKEVIDSEDDGESFAWGDFSKKDAQKALKTGKITIYSSYPIKDGVFVSTSKIQSEQYAGGTGSKVYKKTVPIESVAWINGDEGQFAVIKKNKK